MVSEIMVEEVGWVITKTAQQLALFIFLAKLHFRSIQVADKSLLSHQPHLRTLRPCWGFLSPFPFPYAITNDLLLTSHICARSAPFGFLTAFPFSYAMTFCYVPATFAQVDVITDPFNPLTSTPFDFATPLTLTQYRLSLFCFVHVPTQ